MKTRILTIPAFLLAALCCNATIAGDSPPVHTLFQELTGIYSTLPPPNDQDHPRFGAAVAMHDDMLLVGAPDTNVGGITSRGVVFVFRRQGNAWVRTATLNPAAGIGSSQCGSSIALNRNFVVIGCPNQSIGSGQNVDNRRGRVVFYPRHPDTGDVLAGQPQGFNDLDDTSNARCGTSVSLVSYMDGAFGNHLAAVGCPGRLFGEPGSNVVGGIDLYGWSLLSGWERFHQLTPGALNDPRFGHAVQLLTHGPQSNPERDVLLVAGMPGTFSNEGLVRILRMGETASQWALEHSYSGTSNSQFGYSVHMRGERIAMGAPTRRVPIPGTNPPVLVPAGSLSIGLRTCPGIGCGWVEAQEFISIPMPVATAQNRLGEAVNVPGIGRVLAGEPMNPFGSFNGRVRHYQWDSGDFILNTQEPFYAPIAWTSTSAKGSALASNGAWQAVGAPGDPTSGGRVYIYVYDDFIFADRFEQ